MTFWLVSIGLNEIGVLDCCGCQMVRINPSNSYNSEQFWEWIFTPSPRLLQGPFVQTQKAPNEVCFELWFKQTIQCETETSRIKAFHRGWAAFPGNPSCQEEDLQAQNTGQAINKHLRKQGRAWHWLHHFCLALWGWSIAPGWVLSLGSCCGSHRKCSCSRTGLQEWCASLCSHSHAPEAGGTRIFRLLQFIHLGEWVLELFAWPWELLFVVLPVSRLSFWSTEGLVRAPVAQLHCCRKGTSQDDRMTIRRILLSNIRPKMLL